jgi:4-hydroxy-tetrahydrodipicolinate synthase
VTLFDGEGRLLAEETAAHAHRLAERGVTSILLAGTTGEASMLTSEERVELCRLTKKTLDDRIPVIVGTGDRDQAEAVRRTSAARQAGADAVLAFPPPGVDDSGGSLWDASGNPT